MSKVLPILFALLVQHKPATQKELPPPKPQVINITDDDWVSITPVKGDGEVVTTAKHAPPKNLHVVRKNFIKEVYKSAESL